jgi:hypothetical protein
MPISARGTRNTSAIEKRSAAPTRRSTGDWSTRDSTSRKVRYQADANLKLAILLAAIRQEPAIDFSSALQAELAGLPDLEVLAAAATAGRILVTHDFRTMPKHFADFLKTAASPGVLLVSQRLPVPEVVDQLILIWAASNADEWLNRICRLPL